MQRLLLFWLLAAISLVNAQSWAPKYSINNLLDLGIHYYDHEDTYGPWAIADTLMQPDILNNSQMNMKILKWTPLTDHYEVETTSMKFEIFANRIEIHQKRDINSSLLPGRENFVTMTFYRGDGSQVNNIDFNHLPVIPGNPSEGRFYLIDSKGNIELRINGDDLLMIRPILNTTSPQLSITKVKYNISFLPAYVASSPKIPHRDNVKTLYNKSDVSHVFMDEYGGFGVYLLDNEKENYKVVSGTERYVEYYVTPGKIFWSAFFPPKSYDFTANFNGSTPQKMAQSTWLSYVKFDRPNGYRLIDEPAWSNTMDHPENTFWFENESHTNTLTGDRGYFDSFFNNPRLENGVFVYFGDMALWKDWQFEYVPRNSWGSNRFNLLNAVGDDLHSKNIKFLVYTSPQYFLLGSHYSYVNPYESMPDFSGPDDILYNRFGSTTLADYTFNNAHTPVTIGDHIDVNIPVLRNYDMTFFNPTGTSEVEKAMQATNMPVGIFPPANREGENMWYYLKALDDLSLASNIDGIYMDTFYELNIPRTYQLIRSIKQSHETTTKKFYIFRHASGKEGQDAYLPQIDAYADFVLNGEGNNKYDYYNRIFWRYYISTLNISNSTAVLCLAKDDSSYVKGADSTTIAQSKFINWLNDYNIKVMYPSIKKTGNLDLFIDHACSFVDKFWWSAPDSSALKERIQHNLHFADSLYQCSNVDAEWNYNLAFPSSNSDIVLKGDFNGDYRDDIAIYKTDGSWNFVSKVPLTSSMPEPYVKSFPSFGDADCVPVVGDFNKDGLCDIMLYKPNYLGHGLIRVWISHSNTENLNFIDDDKMNSAKNAYINRWWQENLTFHEFDASHDKLLAADINGDGGDDLIWYKSSEGIFNIYRSDYTTGFIAAPIITDEIPNMTGCIPIVGDFNGDSKYDIAVYKNNGTSNSEWHVFTANDSKLQEILSFSKIWYGKTGLPMTGSFDSGRFDDIMLYGTTTGNQLWNPQLSTTSGTFIDNASWNKCWGTHDSNERPIILDFNGDGIDDFAIYRIAQPSSGSIYVQYKKPGEISSTATGFLPKGISKYSEEHLSYALSNNYPNPFNPTTKINYTVAQSAHIELKVLDVLGREIAVLVNEIKAPGKYTVEFNGSRLSSGVYFYTMRAGDFVSTKKLLLVK
ncbi:MAG: T9SS type A sorting domain-containing protein [Ignavibacteria bacterium]|jgi:hypothetical protein|nr:T9SS type A sorting domain-containing protein [Ignavibacteria bacterium]MCU7505079.1 T9SS type A sorting domain-containing protein [Ignavibacteria bacterium]MCU7515281.1 T9SS type A sorting domain-containing protein [Ignavibacteria bacterium]